MKRNNVKPAEGRLGILIVGCGAVATTFIERICFGHIDDFAKLVLVAVAEFVDGIDFLEGD